MNLHDLKYLEPKSILDIGANVGDWSKQAKEVWPNAQIVMIESNVECIPALAATGIPHKIITLGDRVRAAAFYKRKCGGTSTGDSYYRENTDWYNDDNVEMVTEWLAPLDMVFSNGEKFDLWKCDTQGSEIDILKGGEKLAMSCKAIIMEVPVDSEHEPYNIGAPTQKEVMEYMNSVGFTKHQILEDIVHPIHRYIIQQDVLFTRE